MNSICKFAVVLAITLLMPVAVMAQSNVENKTCCKGKGDKATCCQSEACKSSAPVASATASDGVSQTIACGCCAQGGAAATAPIILALDIDKDGIVSAAEIKNATQSLLALDKNKDGRLERSEMHAVSAFSKVNASTKGTAKKEYKFKPRAVTTGASPNYFAYKMLEADTNGNNILEGAEINANTQILMHIIDLNEDGQLSLDELKKINESVENHDKNGGGGNGGGNGGGSGGGLGGGFGGG